MARSCCAPKCGGFWARRRRRSCWGRREALGGSLGVVENDLGTAGVGGWWLWDSGCWLFLVGWWLVVILVGCFLLMAGSYDWCWWFLVGSAHHISPHFTTSWLFLVGWDLTNQRQDGWNAVFGISPWVISPMVRQGRCDGPWCATVVAVATGCWCCRSDGKFWTSEMSR